MLHLKKALVVLAIFAATLISPSCGGPTEDEEQERAQAWVTEQLVGGWAMAGDANTSFTVTTSSPPSAIGLSRCASNGWLNEAWACIPVTTVPVDIDIAWSDGSTARYSGRASVMGDPGSGAIVLDAQMADGSLFAELQQDGSLTGRLPGFGDFTATRARP